jgi:uncharacterized Zn finger protein
VMPLETSMSTFKCQNTSCGKEFKPEMVPEGNTDCYLVNCPNCGATHESIENLGLPGGPLQYRFRLRSSTK